MHFSSDINLQDLLSPNTSLSVSDRAQLSYSIAQCHWHTMDRPWVQICDKDVRECLASLPNVALADWILHWTLVSKAERHAKATLRHYTTRMMSIDGERLSRDISQGQERLSHEISALVDGADHLRVKHSLFAAEFTEFVGLVLFKEMYSLRSQVTRLTPLRALVQSLTRAVTHIRTLIDAISAHHSRLVCKCSFIQRHNSRTNNALDIFWIVRTVCLVRVLRAPFNRVASCLGTECRVNFTRATDGLLFVQLFVLYPLFAVQLSPAAILLMHSVALLLGYLWRGPRVEKQIQSTVAESQSDWSRARLSLYRQLQQVSSAIVPVRHELIVTVQCADVRARVKLRREWTNQRCSRSIIRHLPGHGSRDSSL